jgi:ATP-dependent helicase STH1/SNF2
MKAQGVPDTNPDFIKARNLLAMIQKQNHFNQMRRMQQRQQSLGDPQAAQAMQNGAAIGQSNGAKPAGSIEGSSAPSISSGPATTTQTATASGPAPTGDGQTPTSATSSSSALSKEQLIMLRAQIGAFKHLSKGLPLPANMQQQIYGHHAAKKAQTPIDAVNAASQVLDSQTLSSSLGTAKPSVMSTT